jgi:hypothetical protein
MGTPGSAGSVGSVGGSGLVRLLTAKAAAAVFVVTAIGGVALAAGTASLPGQHQRADRPPTRTQRENAPVDTPSRTAGRTDRPTPSPSLSLSPSPSPAGLCRAYERDQQNDEGGKALDDPAFSPLITAAGGKDKVAGYCATLLRPTQEKKPEPPPKGQTKKPTVKPTMKPTVKPSPQRTRSTGRSARTQT